MALTFVVCGLTWSSSSQCTDIRNDIDILFLVVLIELPSFLSQTKNIALSRNDQVFLLFAKTLPKPKTNEFISSLFHSLTNEYLCAPSFIIRSCDSSIEHLFILSNLCLVQMTKPTKGEIVIFAFFDNFSICMELRWLVLCYGWWTVSLHDGE